MRQNADYFFGMAYSNYNTIVFIMLTVSIDCRRQHFVRAAY